MTLPSELVSTAVRGTTQPSTQGSIQTADTLLRQCGIRSFQTIGGFIPKFDQKDLYTPYTPNHTNPIHANKLKHLHLILSDHPQMIEEWIQAICEQGQTVPDEYIPAFLELGCQRPHLQIWLKLVMSDTADWLIARSKLENWNWYKNCKVTTIEEVLAQQAKDNRSAMYQISITLASEPLNPFNHSALNLLRSYAPMWSTPIAKILLKAMFVSNVMSTYDENSLLTLIVQKAGYSLPLSFAAEFLAELRTGIKPWHLLADELEATFIMRHEMLSMIRGESE